MRLRATLQVMRRGRWIIVAGLLIGFVVGWLSGPAPKRRSGTFEAVQTLLVDPNASAGADFRRATVLATRGPVPLRVASRLGVEVQVVQAKVFSEFRNNGSVLVITARSADRAKAEALANFTAEELVVELGGPASPVKILEPAVASPLATDDIQGPSSRPGRALLLAAFGLVLGIGAAYAVERLDHRIRRKDTAEEALGLPVLAEVPALSPSERGRMLAGPQPSQFVEAYRRLRTTIDRWAAVGGEGQRVIVVASPIGNEGATTTVAHLAFALGEVGRSVVAISADLRRPRLHVFFDKSPEPGLTDVLRGAPDVRTLLDLNLVTTVRGVRLVPSGAPVRNPSSLLGRIGDHLSEARTLGDFVLIDSPPLLTTADAVALASHADGVLLVVRAGRTSVGAATRSAELLSRLDIPVIGVVLVETDGSAGRRYPRGC